MVPVVANFLRTVCVAAAVSVATVESYITRAAAQSTVLDANVVGDFCGVDQRKVNLIEPFRWQCARKRQSER